MRPCLGDAKSRLVRQSLPADDQGPELELIEVNGDATDTPPIVCIHGAFSGAWVWEPFLHQLGCRRIAATALSVRGHGQSRGHTQLRDAHLEDYVADVRRVIDRLERPPIIIGHSLGALLAQRLIGLVPLSGLVMLTPAPPEGIFFLLPRILASEPALFLQLVQTLCLPNILFRETETDPGPMMRRLRRMAFSEHSSAEDVRRCLSQMVFEPLSVLLQAHLPIPALAAWLLGTPALVISASLDSLVPMDVSARTALYHGAEHVSIRGHGHMLLVEGGAEEVADAVCRWLPSTQSKRRHVW